MQIPGYKIVDTLGRGGMATVYLAIQENFEREVALKVLSPELLKDPAFGERFLREARIVSRLVHPNIVTVYDVGVHEGHHYLAMEYVPGKDLKARRLSLTRAEGLQVVKDVTRALDYAARKGYVHRDVKPENIMLHAEHGRAVLMDFGIARPTGMEQGMTQTGTAIGTPHYMSPEQAKGKSVDARSDLYSLGVVLFLLITGRVPFDADSAVAVGIKHVAEPVPRMPAPFKVFQPIIDRILAKKPEERYQTGLELVDDLNQITDDDLRRVDELIDLAAKRLQEHSTDPDSPTLISSALDQDETGEIVAMRTGEFDAVGQRWPQSGQGEPVRTLVQAPAANPFGVSHWLRNSLLLALLLVSAAFFLRNLLPPPWPAEITRWHHQGLDQLAEWGLPVQAPDWRWLYELAAPADAAPTAQASTPVPATSATPVPTASPEPSETVVPAETPAPSPTLSALADQVLADTRPVLEQDALRKLPAAETSPPVTTAPEASVPADPFAEADRLLALLPDDLSQAEPLAAIYREQLAIPEQRARAQQGLEAGRRFYAEAMQSALDSRDPVTVRALLDSVRASFPRVAGEARFRELEQRLLEVEELQALLAEGQAQLARDALSSPAGDNAVESFEAVLAKDPGNPRATAGLAAVADRYQTLAEAKLKTGDWLSAKGMVTRGLRVQPDHPGLVQLKAAVARQEQALRERQQQVDRHLQVAADQMTAGNLWGADGAVARYQQVLTLDDDNSAARQGLRESVQRMADQVQEFISQGQLERAGQELALAESRLSADATVLSLRTALDQAIESRRPRLTNVRVSPAAQVPFGDDQSLLRGVDRTIYIGVQFSNFEPAAVVQAVLYDGARSVQIAQVPVVLSGKRGEKVFRIDRPVEGFAVGGYNIDLMLDNQLLMSQRFQIVE